MNGTLVKLPAGFSGKIRSHGSTFRAVVIQGKLRLQTLSEFLDPGSYFSSKGETTHSVKCEVEEGCVVYVRMKGKFDVVSTL